MKQTALATNWYIKGVYIEYLSSQTHTPLSPDTILTLTTDDEQPGNSFTATDIQTQQVVTIASDGLVERYTLNKVA